MTRSPDPLASRSDLVRRSPTLGALAARLERFLEPLLGGSVYIPEEKALLSRNGGVCESDGSRLLFDPLSPFHHPCPRCHRIHVGERHHRAWVWRYHIWLSERVIHLALLGAIKRDVALQDRARSTLELYAAGYRDFPNKDNVLVPTRLFFSTYLESIWLSQLVIAALFLRSTAPGRAPNPAERSSWHGFLRVPHPDSESVRVATVAGEGVRIPVNLVVNEMYPDRERRAGQLALSGGGWVYLKGDREHPSSALLAEVF